MTDIDSNGWVTVDEPPGTPLVYGSGLTYLARSAAESGNAVGALLAFPPHATAGQIRAVLERRAEIVGDDVEGFRIEATERTEPYDCYRAVEGLIRDRERNAAHRASVQTFEEVVSGIARWLVSDTIGPNDLDEAAERLREGDWIDPHTEEE